MLSLSCSGGGRGEVGGGWARCVGVVKGRGYREQVGGVRCVVTEVEGCGRVRGMWGGGVG